MVLGADQLRGSAQGHLQLVQQRPGQEQHQCEESGLFHHRWGSNSYFYNEEINPVVNTKTQEGLDTFVNVNNYVPGTAYANIGGTQRVIVDASGNVKQWSQNGNGNWNSQNIGKIKAQGDGTFEISTSYTSGSTNSTARDNALNAAAAGGKQCGAGHQDRQRGIK
jgi:hypothetical protein